jgi:hypothetical protein
LALVFCTVILLFIPFFWFEYFNYDKFMANCIYFAYRLFGSLPRINIGYIVHSPTDALFIKFGKV